MLDQRRKVILAAAASVGLHVLLLLLWAVLSTLFPRRPETPRQPDAPLKVTFAEDKPELTPPPEPEPSPTPTPVVVRPAIDSTDMTEAATPPPDAKVTSARNTTDASELPADGAGMGPTQKGRQNSSFAVASREEISGPNPAQPEAVRTPVPETAPPLPRAVPQPTVAAAKPPPTPAPSTDGYALATPASLPTEPEADAPNPFDPSFRPPSTMTEPPRPTPVPRHGGYQPYALKTAMSGSISNVGSSSVASVASPTGRYQAAIKALIAQRWQGAVHAKGDLAQVGSVTVRFLVGMDGKARGIQVVSNTSNEALAAISLRAIMEAKAPPMPAEVVPETSGGQMPMDLIFEIVDQPRP